MQITWHGASCFGIATKTATIVTDPDASTGSAPSADITILSTPSAPDVATAAGRIDWPGEYEFQDVFVIGIPVAPATAEVPRPATIFVLEAANVSVGFFAGVTGKLTVEQIEQLGDIDILLLPVGGSMDAATAKAVLEQVDPRIVLPMSSDAEIRQQFIESLGIVPESADELKAEERDLPVDTMRVVVLNPKQ